MSNRFATRAIRFSLLLGAGLIALLCGRGIMAADYFITIGGGYNSSGNQVSLERNVIFQQSVLAAKRPDKPQHDIFFSDGKDDSRDLQFREPKFREKCPTARRLMAELLGNANDMDLVYRNHEIKSVTGPSDPKLLQRRLRELSKQIKSGDRLIIYATGHGGPATNDDGDYSYRYRGRNSLIDEEDNEEPQYNRHDTLLYFWDSESIKASEFAGWLDHLPTDVNVVLVMVQCYAGGFAHTIFHQASADLGLSKHARCGFFAQVHDRAAAGCTPDVDEADYQEYSSFFWAALGGRTRTGETITTADYDNSGTVSFAEAHAYAVLESNTIDVPVRTSDEFLRKYSSAGKKSSGSKSKGEATSGLGRIFSALGSDTPKEGAPKLVELQGSLAKLVERAKPEERAIVEGLAKKFELGERATVEAVRTKLTQIETDEKTAGIKAAASGVEYRTALERVQKELREIWPELQTNYSPVAIELASERADEFTKRVESLAAYAALCKARERQKELNEKYYELSRQVAKLQRLLRTAENVILAANLPNIATADIVSRYEKLRAAEEGMLTTPAADATTPAAESKNAEEKKTDGDEPTSQEK